MIARLSKMSIRWIGFGLVFNIHTRGWAVTHFYKKVATMQTVPIQKPITIMNTPNRASFGLSALSSLPQSIHPGKINWIATRKLPETKLMTVCKSGMLIARSAITPTKKKASRAYCQQPPPPVLASRFPWCSTIFHRSWAQLLTGWNTMTKELTA